MKPYSVVIAESQTLICECIREIIDSEPDLFVSAAAHNSDELARIIMERTASVVIIDTDLTVRRGIDLAVWIKEQRKETKVILFGNDLEEDELFRAVAAGVSGFLMKDIQWDDLATQIRQIVKGHLLLPSRLAAKLSNRMFRILTEEGYAKPHVQSLLERFRLTEKEYEISLLMARGLSNKQIAENLLYSDGTVRNYVSNVYEKIGVRNRAKAVIFLRDSGFQ